MPISTDEDEDEEDRGDDALLREALAWIATRNTSFVYALSEEWDLELHRVAERQGVEMKFAKTARDAWTLLRDAICSGRVRAVGVYGAIAEAWFRGEGQELVPDVTDDLELVIGSSLTLASNKLSSSPKQWSHIRINLADLQNEFPEVVSDAEKKSRRDAKRHFAAELLEKHFPNGQQGKSKKEIVTVIMRAAKRNPLSDRETMSEKTIMRAIKDKW